MPRTTSLSVALVHRRILGQGRGGSHPERCCGPRASHPPGPAAAGRHSPLALQDEHHVVDAHVVADEVRAQQPGVCVADVEGLETLAQLVGRSNGSQWAGQVLPGARVVSTHPPLCHPPPEPGRMSARRPAAPLP